MLYHVRTFNEASLLPECFPIEVIEEAKRVTAILDEHYNSQGIDGGDVTIAENKEDIDMLKRVFFNYPDETAEFVDELGDDWISALYINGTEHHETLILPKAICGINY